MYMYSSKNKLYTMKLRGGPLAYCALSMGFAMMSRAFGFYYVKVFLNYYNVKESWFHMSQILYMVWNAVNDPLFALIQDNTNFLLTRTRREGILYTAPLFALSFLIPWIRFGTSDVAVGIHLMISLCLYDTMFTFVGLLSCCLFTELSADQNDRLMLTRYATVAHLIGSQSVLILEYSSQSLRNFTAFQATTFCIALCSCLLMIYTGLNAHTKYDLDARKEVKETEKEQKSEQVPELPETEEPFWRKSWQVLKERNFISFVITNFFQEFHKSFLSSFTAIMCDYLVPTSHVPLGIRSTFYGMTSTVGELLVIFGAPVVGQLGYFRAIRYNFVWKIFGGITMYLIGASNPWLIMLFILLDTSFAGATFTLFNMPLADIADHDKEKYKRKHPISSTVFGTNALVVKPALSLSPMLVVTILNYYGYDKLKVGLLPDADVILIKDIMFKLICFYPVVLGVIQFLAWSQFTIRRRIIEVQIPVKL